MSDVEMSKTAHVNLLMLADLGIPEAVHFRDALELGGNPLQPLAHIPA